MTTYGQTIQMRDGTLTVDGCETRNAATEAAVGMAIRDGWKPRRWWEFWHPPCPAHVRAEFKRQTEPQ